MRAQSSSFDVARMVRELRGMVGTRVRKAYQPHYEQVVLRLNPKGEPSVDLVIVRGKRLYMSRRDRPMPNNPSPFAMILRKHLGNSRLVEVEQLGFDRVVILTLEHGVGQYKLVIELFRDGNVLLLDDNDVILQPLTHAKYASRALKRGEPYTPPPETLDPRGLDRNGLDNLLDNSDHSLIRTLAARANLGRIYGNAVCSAAKIDSDDPADSLEEAQREVLSKSMNKLLEELAEAQGAYIWFEDKEGLNSWKSAQDDPQERESASGMIGEFSPINLPNIADDYVLDYGDQLTILATGSINSESISMVQRDGSVLVNKLTKVYVRGLSLDKAAEAIQATMNNTAIGVKTSTTLSGPVS